MPLQSWYFSQLIHFSSEEFNENVLLGHKKQRSLEEIEPYGHGNMTNSNVPKELPSINTPIRL